MNLTNSQYDQLMAEYMERRNRALELQDLRRDEVYEKLPELRELDAKVRELSVKYVMDGGLTRESYHERMKQLSEDRTRLLSDNGWDPDYLEPVYECEDCQDTGYIDGVRCHCMKKHAVRIFYRDSGLGSTPDHESFDKFDLGVYPDDRIDELTGMTPRDTMREVLGLSKHFVRTFGGNDKKDYANLLIYGDTGVGKTFLSRCIAHELLEDGHSVLYMDAIRLFEILEARQFDRDMGYSDKNALLSYLLESELLIIDDLGTEMTNGFTTGQLFHVVEGRLNRNRSTIITTNLSIRDLNDIYSERVFSRIMSRYQNVRLIGDDIRLRRLGKY